MGDSDDGQGRESRSTIHRGNDMFPRLSIILTAVIAACVAVLAASVGLVGTGNPVKHAADVPDVSRSMMQQAIIETPEWQNFQLLAYTRRADELLRLRDLPGAPTRAVVEFAEQAQADAAVARAAPPFATEPAEDATSAKTVIAALPAGQADSAPASMAGPEPLAAPEPVAETVTPEAAAGGDTQVAGPAADDQTQAASPAASGDTQAASAVAEVALSVVASIAASVKDGADETASVAPKPAVVAKPRLSPKVGAQPAKKKPPVAAAGHRRVASVQGGAGATANAAEKPAAGAKPRGPTVAARPHRKKLHTVRAPRQVAPAASTGFPIDVQTLNEQGTTTNAGLGEGPRPRR
jgi:hypothetical protein